MRSDSDEESESDDARPVLLGFLSRADGALSRLSRHHFPSKVGGRPAWLEPAHLPLPERLRCAQSGEPLKFLLQVYAPVDAVATAFHRTLYVFVTPRGDLLHLPGAVCVLRSQLARANKYYSYESTADGGAERDVAQYAADLAMAPGCDAVPFPEWELVTEDEPRDAGDELPQVDLLPLAEAGGQDEEEEEEEDDDLAEYEDSEERSHFAAFAARVARDPEQCLRYCFDRDVQPLWPALQPTPGEGSIPPCTRCGAPRRFEFQVMPQILNFLDLAEDDAAALDFGTVAVYSCAASCALEPNKQGCAYAEEYAFVQPAAEGPLPGHRTAGLQEAKDE